MEPLPLPPLPTTITTTPSHHHHHNAGGPTSIPLNYPDSGESSPLSSRDWEDPLPQVPGGARLRLMCSYGGHIIPRPHDKSLCYVGGDTRIVVVDRRSSLSDLSSRLSRTLLNGRPFTLKYQLPAEDLDSLISVTTDEDLDNMADEYDRTAATSSSSRLRLFLFFLKPETTASMGALLDDAKSETWFVDALNSTGLLPRGISDPATVDYLLDLGGDINNNNDDDEDDRLKDLEAPNRDHDSNNKIDPSASSSFGSSSSSSSPSMSNLAPIRVRVVEEQFAQLDLSSVNPPQITSTPAPIGADQGLMMNHRGCSDDERSEQGVPVGFRKPPLPLQPLQQSKLAGFGGAGPVAGFSLPSPDSVTSDCSITSANSFCKPILYQDNNMAPASPNTKSEASDPTSQIQIQTQTQTQPQVLDPNYMLDQQQQQQQQQVPDPNYMIGQQQQQQQQQFVRYIPHTANTGAVPVSSYYQIYTQQPQQQQQYHQPVYVMPMTHTQSYMSMQPDHSVGSAGPVTHPPIYPAKSAQPAMVNTPPLLQVPPNQFQQQFVGYAQAHSLAQPGGPGYGFEYSNPHPDQVYYAQAQVAAPLPPQYQTMTPAAMASLTDAANQINTNTAQ